MEQPYLNYFLAIADIYECVLHDYVSHRGYEFMYNENAYFLHFCRGPVYYDLKLDKMKSMNKVDDRVALLKLIPKNLKCAEIGVFKGDYLKLIYDVCEPEELHLVDIWEGRTCSGYKDCENIVWIDNLNEAYENLSDYYNEQEEVRIHKLLSDQFFSIVEDDHLDLVYIDGDRSFEGSYKNLVNAHKKVKNSKFIMGHDYHQDFSGVLDAVNEFCNNYNLKIEHLTDDGLPSYLIVNRK